MLPAHLASDPQFETRFRREAFAAAGLSEPHVVPIHHFGEIDGRLYVEMRLIEGRDLQSIIADGPLEPGRAIGIIDQVASALHAAHRIGLVHRDVKPSNILVGEDDFAYLIDFGLARGADQTGLASTGSMIGTWHYMAPERMGAGEVDARSDIYSLTCVLHECLTGMRPFPGDSVESQVAAHLTAPRPRPSALRGELPAELDTVIATGMAKDPDQRYPTTRDLAEAARAAITVPMTGPAQGGVSPYAPTQLRPVSAPHRHPPLPGGEGQPAKKSRKGLLIALTSVGAAVIVLAVIAAIVVSNHGDRGKSPSAGTTSTALPNTGPFTGTFTADFGPLTGFAGKPLEGAPPPFKETWRLRSVCRPTGCVATASAGGQFPATTLVFDDVGGRWLAVATSAAKCVNYDTERWDVVSVQPRPDGTMSGEWTTNSSMGCFNRQPVTFSRTGETDVSVLPDPASQAPRVVSPAEALHGSYHSELTQPNGFKQEYEYGVRTDCLRTGERCMSDFAGAEGRIALVFGNGKWTRNDEFNSACSSGGTGHVKVSAEFPLPQPAQDPITLLTGHGSSDMTGTACPSSDFDQKFVRTGD